MKKLLIPVLLLILIMMTPLPGYGYTNAIATQKTAIAEKTTNVTSEYNSMVRAGLSPGEMAAVGVSALLASEGLTAGGPCYLRARAYIAARTGPVTQRIRIRKIVEGKVGEFENLFKSPNSYAQLDPSLSHDKCLEELEQMRVEGKIRFVIWKYTGEDGENWVISELSQDKPDIDTYRIPENLVEGTSTLDGRPRVALSERTSSSTSTPIVPSAFTIGITFVIILVVVASVLYVLWSAS